MRISVIGAVALLCIAQPVAAFSPPADPPGRRLSDPETIFRGQSPMVQMMPVAQDAAGAPTTPGYPAPAPTQYPDGTTWNAFAPPTQGDPFLNGGAPAMDPGVVPGTPGAIPGAVPGAVPGQVYAPVGPGYQPGCHPGCGPISRFGANGGQPYQFGWQSRMSLSWLPSESVSGAGASGDMGIFGLDASLRHTKPMPGWILAFTQQFGLRTWDGPSTPGLPGSVFRLGWDIEMETPQNQTPWSISLGFNPSINSDFDYSLSSQAWNIDGRGILYYRVDRFWTVALGAGYWDRVSDRIIPYAGLIYSDDFWEWRMTFPEARVSLFLGNEYMWSKWLYVRGEFHSEAYEIKTRTAGINRREQIQLDDWRILVGLKMDTGWYDWFIEGGWVFDREVEFSGPSSDFDIATGFIGQIGLRF